ncbi:RNA ligase family protein [Kineosporia mesophila]|uniref:RNA ligase family protein n=1 Tax=Kineosporia mesophila TaxID=566012 RepID=A0ABP6ZBL9_9ACTN|nr:RNA ligase family protein [Kineosporia mesophila]
MNARVKYPRTRHLPGSPGASADDEHLADLTTLTHAEVVMTEKMDGENTTIGCGYVHARSVDSRPHPSRTWVRALAGRLWPDLPDGMRVCGENLYARHSIAYADLPSYFLVFSIWQDDICLDWDTTREWADLLGLSCVPVIYRGPFPTGGPRELLRCWQNSRDSAHREGFVVRTADSFDRTQFPTHVAKWVRAGHVQTDQHWMNAPITANQLLRQ